MEKGARGEGMYMYSDLFISLFVVVMNYLYKN